MNSADDVLSAYWSQQLSILELQEALQKQESLNGENAFTFENYITPLFRIERVVRFQSEDPSPHVNILESGKEHC
jgi:hypothetical protein